MALCSIFAECSTAMCMLNLRSNMAEWEQRLMMEKKTTRKGVSRAGCAGEGAESSDILGHCRILIEKPALRE